MRGSISIAADERKGQNGPTGVSAMLRLDGDFEKLCRAWVLIVVTPWFCSMCLSCEEKGVNAFDSRDAELRKNIDLTQLFIFMIATKF
jgi:hypothetical protein